MALSLGIALLACIVTLYRPSLAPPGLHQRSLQVAAASTEVMVAAPNLPVGGSADYTALVNRAILVANVMISPPVLADVGKSLGVNPARIQTSAPITANVPRALIDPGSGGAATDIIASPDLYKIEIQADPSVPLLHIYTQAPSAGGAVRLANSAVQGLKAYLATQQFQARIPRGRQVRVEQLGAARGGVANSGAAIQIAVLAFVGVFGVCLWLIALLTRIGRGWTAARLAEQLQS